MNVPRKRNLFLASVCVVSLLAILPTTGWITHQQFRLIAGQRFPGFAGLMIETAATFDPRERTAATAHPLDFDRQVAAAVQQTGPTIENAPDAIGKPATHALLALRTRFNDRPALQAHLLRYLTLRELKLHRSTDEILIEKPESQKWMLDGAKSSDEKPSDPRVIALAIDTAKRGESLDPSNAYFDQMEAVALFAGHRDDEALVALEAGARKDHWNDYSADEARARWKLATDANGEIGSIPRLALAAGILFPHYAKLREMARLTTCEAIQRELAGDAEGGFRIRRAVARMGAVLREKPTSLIGNLVGISITKIVAVRPGGAPLLDGRSDDRDQASCEAAYVSYLTKIGHPEEARWYVAEIVAGQKVKEIFSEGGRQNDFGLLPEMYLSAWWLGGILLMLMSVWTLVLGGLATAIARRKSVRDGLPLKFRVRLTGLIVSALLMGLIALAVAAYPDFDAGNATEAFDLSTFFAVLVVATIYPMCRLKRGQSWLRALREIGVSTAVLVATAGVVALSIGLAGLSSLGVEQTMQGIVSIDGCSAADFSWKFCAVVGSAIMSLPLFTLGTLAIRSRFRHIPVSVGVSRGMRNVALPVATGLLVLYTASVIGTRLDENIVSAAEEVRLTHEGRYEAALVNAEWPGKNTLDQPTAPKTSQPSLEP